MHKILGSRYFVVLSHHHLVESEEVRFRRDQVTRWIQWRYMQRVAKFSTRVGVAFGTTPFLDSCRRKLLRSRVSPAGLGTINTQTMVIPIH